MSFNYRPRTLRHCGWALRGTIKKKLPPTLVRVNSGGVHIYLKTSYDASSGLTSRRLTQPMRLVREIIETSCLKPLSNRGLVLVQYID